MARPIEIDLTPGWDTAHVSLELVGGWKDGPNLRLVAIVSGEGSCYSSTGRLHGGSSAELRDFFYRGLKKLVPGVQIVMPKKPRNAKK